MQEPGGILQVLQQTQGDAEQVGHFNVGQCVFTWPFLPQIEQVWPHFVDVHGY